METLVLFDFGAVTFVSAFLTRFSNCSCHMRCVTDFVAILDNFQRVWQHKDSDLCLQRCH